MPLPSALFTKISDSHELVINMLGVPAVWTQTKAPNETLELVVGFKTASKDDVEVVNAYGYESKIITFKASDFPTNVPIKFDTIDVADEKYTLDEVLPIHLNGVVIGYKGYVRGK